MNDQHTLIWGAGRLGRRASQRVMCRDRRVYALLVGLLLLVAAACLLYLSQASTVAALHYRLLEARQEQDRLAEEIALARTDLANADRQEVLEARAERLGLVDAPASGPYVMCYVPAAEPATAAAPQRQALRP